uniref:LIM zinc-binding domain-containing protein n=1 Tax=Leptobrachium leishanense TaxID=445787 RepID=A0A8C5MTQ8_9ANUR
MCCRQIIKCSKGYISNKLCIITRLCIQGETFPGTASRASSAPAMPKCPKCQKEVYFAERVSSLGKDWHRPCLKCEKCSKTLSPGGHAEHEGKPYCNQPCYAALFGPKGKSVRSPKPRHVCVCVCV